MPKMKTKTAAKKRFKVSANGKVSHKHAFSSHILTKKSPKRKRHLREFTLAAPVDEARMKRMIIA